MSTLTASSEPAAAAAAAAAPSASSFSSSATVAPAASPSAPGDCCTFLPLDAEGVPIVLDESYTPQGVGEPLRPSAAAVKFQRVVFLGTGSAIPSPGRRNTSSFALLLSNATSVLFDCGEGTQHQIMKANSVGFAQIATVCVTHLHGDHCFGLFGMLCTAATQGRTEPVLLIGPRGLREMVVTVLRASGGFPAYPLRFLELEHGRSYPDLGIINGGLRLEAYPLQHRVASFGFIVREGLKPGELLVQRARQLGASGKELGKLKEGVDVTLADGRVVRSADCVGPPIRARSLALLQDTYDSSAAAAACMDVDLLVHECTYSAGMRAKAIAHGHSTSAMVGEFAAQVRARMVVMTHFSNRYETREQTTRRVEAAVAAAASEAAAAAGSDGVQPAASATGPVTAAAIAASKNAKQAKRENQKKKQAPNSAAPSAGSEAAAADAAAPTTDDSSVASAAPAAVASDVTTLDELIAECLVAYRETASAAAAAAAAAAAPTADAAAPVPSDAAAASPAGIPAVAAAAPGPVGGVHAAEDFLVIESVKDALVVSAQRDRVFANELMERMA